MPSDIPEGDGEGLSILNLYTPPIADEKRQRPPYSVPEEHESVDKDFFYEASRLLNLMQLSQRTWEFRLGALAKLEETTHRRYKYLHIYNFIALAMVRRPKSDVCAVTCYQ